MKYDCPVTSMRIGYSHSISADLPAGCDPADECDDVVGSNGLDSGAYGDGWTEVALCSAADEYGREDHSLADADEDSDDSADAE